MRKYPIWAPLLQALGVALVALALGAPPAAAQYFGQNKVQYESFNFQILQTEHFDVYYYPEEREAAVLAGRMAERWYSRLSRLLGHQLGSRQPLIMYASHPQFEQTNALSGELGEATGGVTEVIKRRIVLPFAAGLKDTDHVIGHELVHAFQYDITGQGRSVQTGGLPGALRLPLWFIEGMAEYMSIGPVDPNTAMWMRDQTRRKLPSISDLNDPYKWFPYRYGQAVWAYLAGRYGDEVVGRLLKVAGRSNDPEQAMSRMLGTELKVLSDQWHASLHAAYDSLIPATSRAADYGRAIFGERDVMNVSPVLSPDGRRLAFLSTRDLFSVDLYIGDVETGKILHKLTHTATDPHFESLQFIASAGTWSPDGKTFAFAGITKGHPIISLIDAETGARQPDIPFPQLGEIYDPAWSPDGRYLAFSALQDGLSDLFVYDLQTQQLQRLTNDPFGDLEPAWSPDGKQLAFVSDRFTTHLDDLQYGEYQIVTMDMATKAIEPVPGFATGKNVSPQWSADGKSIYFISDHSGISDLYRADLADGSIAQVTNLYTGVSGITPTSPAFTLAARADRAVFSVYENGSYAMYYADDPTVLAGRPVAPPFAVQADRLPPLDPIGNQLSEVLADVLTGLPDSAEFATKKYGAGLGLDYIAQPQLLVASSQFGTYIGAGAALYWSDMLGNRNLTTALQVNGGYKDITAVLGYVNLSHRLNWGAFAEQIPYIWTSYYPVLTDSLLYEYYYKFRQTNRDLSAQFAYPLSRAERFEFSAGVRDVRFTQEVKTIATDAFGNSLNLGTVDSTLAPGITVGTGSLAFVYDQSIFGATSPILGQRFRFEASPVMGSIDYLGVLGDYRRYVVPVRPFTIAARLLHYGRYFSGGEDPRLQALFIGYPGMVRGYSDGSFQASDCVPSGRDPCPAFSQLLGSRIAMANLELRFPLLGALGVGSGYYGFLPIEMALFADAGMAWWSKGTTLGPSAGAFFLGGDRKPVYSVGVAARINVLGFMVVEVDLAHPFNHGPNSRWVWQFGFVPGY
jgi:Tol biopolymer transport system component